MQSDDIQQPDLRGRALAWIEDDPDPASRAELSAIVAGLPGTRAELADRLGPPLRFGTAGIRGPVRAGPNGMNRAVVRGVAAGLLRWLADRGVDGPLVIGYDARHGSREFAEETALVCTGAGRPALLLPRPLPTPVLAFAVRRLGAVAGVMVTASHNPPRDNGYKVYLGQELGGPDGGGGQIVTPVDAEIEAAIRRVGPLTAVPLGDGGEPVSESVVESYVNAAVGLLAAGGPRKVAVVYTPLHGVGAEVMTTALARSGFGPVTVVPEQGEPDPRFPTVAFPNPEEPGALDLALDLAERTDADIVIANDPDADRCAVALRDGRSGWRRLAGDEVGILLADHLMRRGQRGLYATTIVSSSQLRALCTARGFPYAETLTGFKWIVRAKGAGDLVFGYEEALGYCVAPGLVRDKDGIMAGLLIAEIAAGLKAEGRDLLDRLDDLAAETGVYLTDQLSVRFDAQSEIDATMARLRARPVASLLGEPAETTDLAPGADVLVVRTPATRWIVRPSGTEPKIKAYLEVKVPPDKGVGAARETAAAILRDLAAQVRGHLDPR